MDQEIPIEDRNSFWRDNRFRLLVCGVLALCGVCALGLVAVTVWGWELRSWAIATDPAPTALAVATQQTQANATAITYTTQQTQSTATASARRTEQAQYQLVDRFDNNHEDWLVSIIDNEDMAGSVKIIGGTLLWDIQKVKQPFVDSINFHYMDNMERFNDFDVYVDSEIVSKQPGDACSGFVFREDTYDWEQGAYIFSVCNDSTFNVYYYKEGDWESILRHAHSKSIRNSGWNRLEISARGDDFTFLVNHEVIYEMTDDREPRGGLSLYIEVKKERPLSISFDNFGLQSR